MGTKLPRKLEDKMKVVGGRTKARKTKRVCQKYLTHPLFSFMHYIVSLG